ncbi:MAG: PAS domain-containing protein [Deltaproteobacteria bacterium]|nr:PAS domain-containing protein [Deltaproteobacteria bacterium]
MNTHILLFIFFLVTIAIISLCYSIWRARNDQLKLSSIVQGFPIPTFVISGDHKIIYWNKALEELSGIKSNTVIGTNGQWQAFYKTPRPCLSDLILDNAMHNASKYYSGAYSKSELLHDAYELTEFFPELGDKGKWLRINAAGIRNSRGGFFGAMETVVDITEAKAAQDELMRRTKLESLGTFADGVAKDFDGLLSAILRNVFLAKISASEEDKILESGLAIAEKASLQAKELAHRLITFAQGGHPLPKIERLDHLIRQVVEKVFHDTPGHTCRLLIADDLWPAKIDAVQIKYVIENMLSNAVEAMPEGGIVELVAENTTTVTNIKISEKSNYIRIIIKDRGTGIPQENLSKIFDPYFTTKEKKSRGGIGLGLATCDSIIKYHNGLITLESTVGIGSTFTVYLPATSENGG